MNNKLIMTYKNDEVSINPVNSDYTTQHRNEKELTVRAAYRK